MILSDINKQHSRAVQCYCGDEDESTILFATLENICYQCAYKDIRDICEYSRKAILGLSRYCGFVLVVTLLSFRHEEHARFDTRVRVDRLISTLLCDISFLKITNLLHCLYVSRVLYNYIIV